MKAEDLRHIDKRKWVCNNPNCAISHECASGLFLEVPANKKCPFCDSDITLLGEPQKTGLEMVAEISR